MPHRTANEEMNPNHQVQLPGFLWRLWAELLGLTPRHRRPGLQDICHLLPEHRRDLSVREGQARATPAARGRVSRGQVGRIH